MAHEAVGGGPVRVAVEQRPGDPAREHTLERLLGLLRAPGRDDLVPAHDALDPEAFLVAWPASEADPVRVVAVLERLGHEHEASSAPPVHGERPCGVWPSVSWSSSPSRVARAPPSPASHTPLRKRWSGRCAEPRRQTVM